MVVPFSAVQTVSAPPVQRAHAPEPSEHAAAPSSPRLVPLGVTRTKLAAELADWRANEGAYRRRGWVLLSADMTDMVVDVGFIASVAFGSLQLSVLTAAIRLRYDNYDLWPPSLTFIDPRTGDPSAPPVQALERLPNGEIRNALLAAPETGQPFLCLPGLREYHRHPQHTGDDWLLHRGEGAGRLAVICDRVWRRMALNVIGLTVQLQSIPALGTQLVIQLGQGDVTPSVQAAG